MRRWMMAGGAAMMVVAGTAGAVEPASDALARPARTSEAKSEVRGSSATVYPSEARDAVGADPSSFVTHDELSRFRDTVVEQLEHERHEQQPAPTFTDAG
jgi:hypothetical protein